MSGIILDRFERAKAPAFLEPGEMLRSIRSVQILEAWARRSGKARAILEELGSGVDAAILTREARAALKRIGPRK